MKRSRQIRLVLIGSLTAGTVSGCGKLGDGSSPGPGRTPTTAGVYTNNHQVAGVGHYHAPFRAWFPEPYNRFDPARGLYYQGGQWLPTPHSSITNLSNPTPEAVQAAAAAQTSTRRGGFGGTSMHRSGFLA